MKPSKIDVLRAVTTAVQPRSAYINDEMQRWHREMVARGHTGHGPSSAFVLRRLRECVAEGWLEQSQFPDGMYGYTWTITDAGRARLERDRIETATKINVSREYGAGR